MLNAIPKDWIKRINEQEQIDGKIEYSKVFLKKEKGEMVCFNEGNLIEIYGYFREIAFVKPIANSYWTQRYQALNEKNIWRNVRLKYMEPVLENFNYMQRQLLTNRNEIV